MFDSTLKRLALALILAPLLAVPSGSAWAAGKERPWYSGRADFFTGLDYRSGDYGRALDTDILFVPFSVRYRFQKLGFTDRDQFWVRVSVPFVRVEGPERGNASPGALGTDQGVGNTNLRFTYVFRRKSTWFPDIYLSQKIKFPTASAEKNLGSGEYDFTTNVIFGKRFKLRDSGLFRSIRPAAMVGYKVVGEPPGEARNNSIRTAAWATLRVSKKLSVGFRYSFRESTIPGRGSRQLVSPYLGYRFASWLRVTPYAVFGVSTNAPDWGTGLVIRLSRRVR